MPDTAALAAAFIRDICAEPDRDDIRLIYADWLEDHGQPERAEFIRVQLEMEKVRAVCLCGSCVKCRGGGQHHNGPCGLDRREHGFLRRRKRELLRMDRGGSDVLTNETAWLANLLLPIMGDGQPNDGRVFRWKWRRGFIEEIHCSCQDWLAHGPTLVCQTPLRVVTLADAGTERIGNRDPDISFWRIILPRPKFVNPFHLIMGWHRTEAEAWRDLSNQVLAWARREAGLPSTDNPQSTGS